MPRLVEQRQSLCESNEYAGRCESRRLEPRASARTLFLLRKVRRLRDRLTKNCDIDYGAGETTRLTMTTEKTAISMSVVNVAPIADNVRGRRGARNPVRQRIKATTFNNAALAATTNSRVKAGALVLSCSSSFRDDGSLCNMKNSSA